jgi:hypothetical protein
VQTGPLNAPPPTHKLRPGALVVSWTINVIGALVILFAMSGHATLDRTAAAWALIQFLSGVWAGVLGANTPLLHGLVAGLPALTLGLLIPGPVPAQGVIVTYALAPAAALVAAALMRFMRRRGP